MTGSATGRLAGKVGIITGGAGGIGSAAARAFVDEGAVVGLLDRPSDRLDELSAELGAAAVPLPADVTDDAQVARAFAVWAESYDRLDYLYVCAGQQLLRDDGPIGEVTLETWSHTLAVNLTGAFSCVRHGIDGLRRSGSGSLLICGSPTALTLDGAGCAAYAASKAGMMTFARTVAGDYAQDGVRANIVVPGITETPLIAEMLAQPDTRSAWTAGVPIGRIGRPEDLAGLAVFLASDESRYATGATFCVDGGLTRR